MSDFEVIRRGRDGAKSFAAHLYEIRKAGQKIAEYRHSYRNEDHEIRRSSLGQWEGFDDILEGGGPQTLQVSSSGTVALTQYLAKTSNV